LREEEMERVISAMGRLAAAPIYIEDTAGLSIMDVRSRARRLQARAGVDLIIIDYLQLMQGRRSENRVQEVSEISRGLKALARELNVPVIALSQLSRAVEGRTSHVPMLSDLRESGSIEQDADIVMFIYREDVYYTEEEWDQQFPGRPYPRNIAEIIVAKHRHGPTGSVKLRFRDNLVRFEALARGSEDF